MRIVFISNYFNHHQKTLSEELNRLTEGKYTFIETLPMTEERQKLGWGQEEKPSYVISICEENRVCDEVEHADVIILGSVPEKTARYAMQTGKLIFKYSERPLKNGMEPLKYIPRLVKWNLQNPMFKPVHMLCASAYTAGDYARFGMFRNKCFRWGYFPETQRYPDIQKLLEQKNPTNILWTGRFLEWKHPEAVLEVAKRLKDEGYSFSVDFIGNGVLEKELKKRAEEFNLSKEICFRGSMSPEEVRKYMEKAGIFLFTSDRKEGWGAVLNEAMNSGCAVAASHEAGAVPYLVTNDENGLVYESGNVEMLYEKVKYLLNAAEEQKRLGQAAYETIVNEWNGEMAAARLLQLAEELLSNKNGRELYESGPCSPAPRIRESWF